MPKPSTNYLPPGGAAFDFEVPEDARSRILFGAILWLMSITGMNEIGTENLSIFISRVRLMEKLFGHLQTIYGEIKMTDEELSRAVGMKCDCNYMPPKEWSYHVYLMWQAKHHNDMGKEWYYRVVFQTLKEAGEFYRDYFLFDNGEGEVYTTGVRPPVKADIMVGVKEEEKPWAKVYHCLENSRSIRFFIAETKERRFRVCSEAEIAVLSVYYNEYDPPY